MFRRQNWGSVLWMSVTWIQRVLRFLVCLKGRTTSDTCKCTSLKVSRDFRTQRTIRKRLFCSACIQSDTIGTRDSWLLNPEWDRLGSGLSIKTWAFHCQNVKLDESWEAQRCVYMLPLCITNIKLFLARFIAFVVIRDLVRRESNVCVWNRSVTQWGHTPRFLYV